MGHPITLLTFTMFLGQGMVAVLAQSSSVSLVSVRKKSGCIKVSHCKCILGDGSGLIDLESLADVQGFLVHSKHVPFEDTPQDTEVLLSFSPCLPFSQPEFTVTDCTDVAACLILRNRRYTDRYVNYGRHEDNKFHYNETTKTLSVSYSASSYSEAQTVVHYRCSPNRSISYNLRLRHSEAPLQIWVESPCACPNACAVVDVGPGTIFLIILCLSITAYFILGSCALRPFRSSSGVQIAPEDSVWCMLCYKFTDQPSSKRKRHCSLREDTL
ncbi:uncharacterized protein LOC118814067 [Colossoma macropomum]|uniref:uncharacterized protein LOC118814067 n=1 Tax=Colossoma macropomum TaxID=42526 RepID=UPI001863F98D|nr:uncharacterized protein LOC118814067 [Colossoma macropomum]